MVDSVGKWGEPVGKEGMCPPVKPATHARTHAPKGSLGLKPPFPTKKATLATPAAAPVQGFEKMASGESLSQIAHFHAHHESLALYPRPPSWG